MTVFEHPIWKYVAPYFHVPAGGGARDNVDLLDLPDDLRALALGVVVNCCACGAVIHPFRVRAKSGRARIAGSAEERRLFYASTCASADRPGCCRTNSASEHKLRLLREIGK